MATILTKPEGINLSGNMNKFILASSSLVSFAFKRGTKTILEKTYEPATDGRITIDVQDIVESELSFLLKDTQAVYIQPDLVADFTAVIDGASFPFRVIRSGVAAFNDTASNFLTYNFLTWQPTQKKVTYYTPEFLTYYATVNCTLQLRAYFEGNETQIIKFTDLSAGNAYTIPLQYGIIAGKFNNRLPGAYEVWIQDQEGKRLTYIQRYLAEGMKSENESWVLFENSLGGIDTFRAYGEQELNAEHTHNLIESENTLSEYRVDTERLYTKNTGYITKQERKWLLDFFPATKKYLFNGDFLQAIVASDSMVNYNTEELPSNYSFTYQFAETKPLLNISRTDTLPLLLEIEIPDVGSFTVPPRLVEFPSLSLSEGALFPVQSPYSENWGTVSAGYLAQYLIRLLGNDAGGTGGIGHVHDNIDLLQLLSYLEEYLLVGGKKIKAGYSDESELAREFQTRNFINSMSAGKGGAIDADGNTQVESLEVRSYLKVLEMIFNRLNIQEGDYVFTEGGAIESVQQEDDDAYLLRIRKRYDDDMVPFVSDDIIYGIYHHTGGFFTSWMRVVNVNITANTILVVLGADSEVPAGKNYAPVAGMNLARRGNFTNSSRQSSWYLSSYDGELVFLDKVDNYKTVAENRALVLGLPKNLPIPDNLPINPDQPYLYARGIIVQDIHRINYNGKIIRDSVDRGIWSAIVAASYEPYRFTETVAHEVWHNSCKYQCIVDKTLQEPKWNSTDWLLLAGNPEFTIDIVSSNGLDFDYGEVDTTLSIAARIHHTDVTADLLDSDISWTRESGDLMEDNAWNISKSGAGKAIHITTEDVGGYRFVTAGSCKFICTAYLRDGNEVREAKQEIPFGL